MLAGASRRGLIAAGAEVAVEATGLDTRYASPHSVNRSGYQRFTRLAWPKRAVACHTTSHRLLGAVLGRGPSRDSPHSPPAVRRAARLAAIGRVLGGAAYDAEQNHVLCRDRLGIPESVFRLDPRNTGREWPRAP